MTKIFAKPSSPALLIPIPGDSRMFPAAGMTIDAESPFWRALLAEGSLVVSDRPKPEQQAGTARRQKG